MRAFNSLELKPYSLAFSFETGDVGFDVPSFAGLLSDSFELLDSFEIGLFGDESFWLLPNKFRL